MSVIIPKRLLPFQTGGAKRVVWDFAGRRGVDLASGVYPISLASRSLFVPKSGRVGLMLNESFATGESSAEAIPSSTDFAILAWVWFQPDAAGCVLARGRDGFGDGWSLAISIDATKSITVATVETSTYVGSTTRANIAPGKWVALGCVCQRTTGAEPSHLTSFLDGDFFDRKGYEGRSAALRSSSTGVLLGEVNGVFGRGITVGRVSIFDISAGTLETTAKNNLLNQYLIERSFFRPQTYEVPFSAFSGEASISWSSLAASNMTPTTATLTIGGITR